MTKGMITVVLPVYGVEQYLDRCIESVVNQTYTNLEIILVDDGSKDRCPQMCDAWAKRDPRIKVIHKENGGLSDARNAGIAAATGEYITFIDSDDSVHQEYAAYLFQILEENDADLSTCEICCLDESGRQLWQTEDNGLVSVFFQKDALKEMLLGKQVSNSACAKLYKTAHFSGIRFPRGRLYEDIATTYRIFFCCDTIAVGRRALYVYHRRGESLTAVPFTADRMDLVVHSEEMAEAITGRYPDLEIYGKCKRMGDCNEALLRVPLPEHAALFAQVFARIRAMRMSLLTDPKTPAKYRILSLVSFGGKKLYAAFLRGLKKRQNRNTTQ